MKAILVIDMPDHLNSINNGILKPIGTVGKLEIGYGSDDGEMIRFEFIDTDGALLKPMPQKKDTGILEGTVLGQVEQLVFEGWNRCIDEILGETE